MYRFRRTATRCHPANFLRVNTKEGIAVECKYMQKHWVQTSRNPTHLNLPLHQMGVLLSRLGLSGRDAVAEDLLRLIDVHVPLAQCTIFSFEAQNRPRTVAIGDRSRTQALAQISDAYVSQFYRHDGILDVMHQELDAARQADQAAPRILLHRQRGEDIVHAEYRRTCYELPQVAERLAVLALFEGRRWLSVNLYRGHEHGPFNDASIALIEAFAPLIVHAVRLHHTGQRLDQDLSDWLLSRLAQRQPELTKRDIDVVRCLMAGDGTQALAERLGLTIPSAQTYQKRVYRKLGVGGHRELLGLLMSPSG
jgi:DNA-binding CsgD family transcriptional regulator